MERNVASSQEEWNEFCNRPIRARGTTSQVKQYYQEEASLESRGIEHTHIRKASELWYLLKVSSQRVAENVKDIGWWENRQ